jgi:cytochrome c-type biogenesis protein CcmH
VREASGFRLQASGLALAIAALVLVCARPGFAETPASGAPVAAADRAPDPGDVTVTITGDAKALKPGDMVFLFARAEGVERGMPTWVRRVPVTTLPMDLRLGPPDNPTGSPTPAKVVITARIDRDGDPLTRGAGDLEGKSDAVAPGASGVRIALTAVEGAVAPVTAAIPAVPIGNDTPATNEAGGVAIDPAALLGPPDGPQLSGAELAAKTREVAKKLRCVVCQGLSVQDSPSETAQAMRKEVEHLVAQGYDTDQVLAYFEASYGEFVLLEPKKEGFSALVWVMPVAFLGIGGAVVAWTVRSRAKGTGGPAARSNPAPADDLEPWLERVRRETRGDGGAS